MIWPHILNILLTGRYPANDRRGRKHPQAGQPINSTDWKLAVIFLKGDWEFPASIVHLPRWDSADNMCSSCSASNLENSNFLWTNPGADGWKSTKRNHTDFCKCNAGARADNQQIVGYYNAYGIWVDFGYSTRFGSRHQLPYYCEHLR
jgi:hypothetical protein